MTQASPPLCRILPESQRYEAVAMRSLRFDGTEVAIDMQGPGFKFASVLFKRVAGFRVLDERDLCEFWPEYSDRNGWLWEVLAGGWIDLERQRDSFSSPSVFSPLREFLIVGDHCISVICSNEPEIVDLGA